MHHLPLSKLPISNEKKSKTYTKRYNMLLFRLSFKAYDIVRKKEYKDAHIKNMGLLRRYFWLDSHGMLFRNGTFNIFVVLSLIVIVVIASSCAHTLTWRRRRRSDYRKWYYRFIGKRGYIQHVLWQTTWLIVYSTSLLYYYSYYWKNK